MKQENLHHQEVVTLCFKRNGGEAFNKPEDASKTFYLGPATDFTRKNVHVRSVGIYETGIRMANQLAQLAAYVEEGLGELQPSETTPCVTPSLSGYGPYASKLSFQFNAAWTGLQDQVGLGCSVNYALPQERKSTGSSTWISYWGQEARDKLGNDEARDVMNNNNLPALRDAEVQLFVAHQPPGSAVATHSDAVTMCLFTGQEMMQLSWKLARLPVQSLARCLEVYPDDDETIYSAQGGQSTRARMPLHELDAQCNGGLGLTDSRKAQDELAVNLRKQGMVIGEVNGCSIQCRVCGMMLDRYEISQMCIMCVAGDYVSEEFA